MQIFSIEINCIKGRSGDQPYLRILLKWCWETSEIYHDEKSRSDILGLLGKISIVIKEYTNTQFMYVHALECTLSHTHIYMKQYFLCDVLLDNFSKQPI